MKKHNEGYSLPLVLVVMAVLAALASGLMTVVMRNMEAQQSSVAIMQNQYAAQGKLEMVISELCQFDFADAQGFGASSEAVIKNEVKEICDQYDVGITPAEFTFGFANNTDQTSDAIFDKPFSYEFRLIAENESVQVTYDVTYSGKVAQSSEGGRTYFLITAHEITYHSYKADMV